jgi:hypothetical protein
VFKEVLELAFDRLRQIKGTVVRGANDETGESAATKRFKEAQCAMNDEGFVAVDASAFWIEVVGRNRGKTAIIECHRKTGSDAGLSGGIWVAEAGLEGVDGGDFAARNMLDPTGGVEGALADESTVGGFILRA